LFFGALSFSSPWIISSLNISMRGSHVLTIFARSVANLAASASSFSFYCFAKSAASLTLRSAFSYSSFWRAASASESIFYFFASRSKVSCPRFAFSSAIYFSNFYSYSYFNFFSALSRKILSFPSKSAFSSASFYNLVFSVASSAACNLSLSASYYSY
jgi:hypothetical protein